MILNIFNFFSTQKKFFSVLFILLPLILIIGCLESKKPKDIFEDVTLTSGFGQYKGMTHGISWGDFDNDSFADVYITNHLNQAQLFHNLGDGQFADISKQLFKTKDLNGDKHGAAWADFDNDGFLDLAQLTGAGRGIGSEPKRLFRNDGNQFIDVAKEFGVSNDYGRTRTPLWLDVNGDGRLDLFQGAEVRFDKQRPPYLFVQQKNSLFIADQDSVPFKGRSVPFCIITEMNNDMQYDLVCRVVGQHRTNQIFDLSKAPISELDLLPITAFEDVASGDFDNDGAIDLFLARKNPSGVVAFGRSGSNVFISDIQFHATDSAKQKTATFEFHSNGFIDFRVNATFPTDLLNTNNIYIGKNGYHPKTMTFSLSKETAGISGLSSIQNKTDAGVYIGFFPPDKWQVLVSDSTERIKQTKYRQITLKVSAHEPVTNLQALDELALSESAPARLFMNRNGQLIEESDKRGVNEQLIPAVNVVTGDFDNDMDLDLFVLASGDIGKQKNLLLLNDGDGFFSLASDAGGAAGPLAGVGDSVTTTDFDNDGFLDLFIATGGSMGRSLGVPSEEGGYRLYHNVGNKNHWLELDLQGTTSNRNGLGSIVKLDAGGTTQTRIQDGGMHHRSQNNQRIHFGLGQNAVINNIKIHWPSGTTQSLNNVQADQILRIKEPPPKNSTTGLVTTENEV